MEQAEPPSPAGTNFPFAPADFRRRALARLTDLAIAVAPLWLLPRARAAELIAVALLLTADALAGPGRSPGKRLFGLRAVQVPSRRPAGLRESLRRNSVFALGLAPALAGAPLPFTLGALLAIALVETLVALRPLTRDLGRRRLGDLFARTQVVDGSVALQLPERLPVVPARRAVHLASRAA